jgi:hypothetical protein
VVNFDLGPQGLGILIVISLTFGVIAQVVLGKGATRWLWLVGAAGWFVVGVVASEVVFGAATEDELQPIIDGLCFDEALLGGLLVGLPVVLVTWYLTRRGRLHGPMPS